MNNSAQDKIIIEQTKKTSNRAIRAFISLIAVFLVSLSIVKIGAARPQQVDMTGLDILCQCNGCEYFPPILNSISCCNFPDGKAICCDSKTDKCAPATTPLDVKKASISRNSVDNIVTTTQLQRLDSQLSNLSSQVASLLQGQNTLASLVGDVQALCSLSDLVPLARPLATPGTAQPIVREPGDVCQRDANGNLVFRVHNQGGIDAPASTTRVFFGCPNATCTGPTQVDVATPALLGFSGVELVVPIPNSCFSTTTLKCDFTIGVDVAEAVTEANEANNATSGVCGPSIL
jgi:hypothetical protein